MQQFPCPSCGRLISAASPAGSLVQCPLCSQTVTVPLMNAPATSPQPYQHTGVPVVPQKSPSRGFAVTSLVFGLLGVTVGIFACPALLSVVAVIVGVVALVKCRSDDKDNGRGMAISGIATGVLGLVMGPLLWAMMIIPWFGTMGDVVTRGICSSNLQQIGFAIEMYAERDPNGAYPADLGQVVNAGYVMAFSFECPTQPMGQQTFFYVPGRTTSSDLASVLIFENPSNHGGAGGHVLYLDGTIEWMDNPEFQEIVDEFSDVAI